MQLTTWLGDITKCTTDAIVNASNNALANGSGVNGAIHRAAGPRLAAFCSQLGGCDTGAAILTPGFDLPAKYIIHTAGPVWQGGNQHENELLASCYRSCIAIAQANSDIDSIAFPAISTGIFGFPLQDAAKIALHTITTMEQPEFKPLDVLFVCFDQDTFNIYKHFVDGYMQSYAG